MIKRPETQQRTIKALGLGRINKSVQVELTPQIAGMITKVNHLITVKEL
jgi:large subunit ribosomal protein L30